MLSMMPRADGRPFRNLDGGGDNWSRCSPVLEARFRMTGETLARCLIVSWGGQGPRSITVDHGTEFQCAPEDWAIGGASSSTLFVPASPWKTPLLNRLTSGSATSV